MINSLAQLKIPVKLIIDSKIKVRILPLKRSVWYDRGCRENEAKSCCCKMKDSAANTLRQNKHPE